MFLSIISWCLRYSWSWSQHWISGDLFLGTLILLLRPTTLVCWGHRTRLWYWLMMWSLTWTRSHCHCCSGHACWLSPIVTPSNVLCAWRPELYWSQHTVAPLSHRSLPEYFLQRITSVWLVSGCDTWPGYNTQDSVWLSVSTCDMMTLVTLVTLLIMIARVLGTVSTIMIATIILPLHSSVTFREHKLQLETKQETFT